MKRLCNTEKRSKKNLELASSYNAIINSYLNKGYVTKVNVNVDKVSEQWLLPHFLVLRPD